MPRNRLIPCLLLHDGGVWKTRAFDHPRYIGDPINTARILNEKHVDELLLIDIDATVRGTAPDVTLVNRVATECFMPVCYGGGVRDLGDFHRLFEAGVEKVAVNAVAVADVRIVAAAAAEFGSQSVVVAIDVRDGGVVTHRARRTTGLDPVEHARAVVAAGAGELLVTAVEREGSRQGLDLDLIAAVAGAVTVPVVAHGGLGSLDHAAAAYRAGAAAVAGGSMFVYHGRRDGILVTYPERAERLRCVG